MYSWLSPSIAQAWVLLIAAGVLEVAWAIGMKSTDGSTRWVPSAIVLTVALVSLALLGLAMKTLPAGTAYAVWVGIGAAGTVLLGMLLFDEPASAARLACIALVVAGVLGLKLLHD